VTERCRLLRIGGFLFKLARDENSHARADREHAEKPQIELSCSVFMQRSREGEMG